MNEPLPYDDELSKRLSNLPLPDADKAWKDMQRRLDKEDNDRPLIPPFLKGCALSLLVFLLVGLGVYLVDPFEWRNSQHSFVSDSVRKTTIVERPGSVPTGLAADSGRSDSLVPAPTNDTALLGTALKRLPGKPSIVIPSSGDTTVNQHPPKFEKDKNSSTLTESRVKPKQRVYAKENEQLTNQPAITGTGSRATNNRVPVQDDNNEKPKEPVVLRNEILPDKPGLVALDTLLKPVTIGRYDSTAKVDSIKKPSGIMDTTAAPTPQSTPAPAAKFTFFSAGIGEQQLIPVAGQKMNPYNSQGRKNALSDYIPSVYFRMHKTDKWFLHLGFRYGAPQYNREVLFAQQKRVDSFSIPTTLNSNLKKTFYHQLPVSFNYFVRPGFSIGAGVTLNKFASAIVQQDLYRGITGTPIDTLLGSVITKAAVADTNFVKVYLQGLVEAQYQWKRFSGGLRYSFGLQPYLKFQLGGGQQQKESNRSLQVFIQYELWKSRKVFKK